MRIIDYLMRNAVERVARLMVYSEDQDAKYGVDSDWGFNLLPEDNSGRKHWFYTKQEAISAAEAYLRSELPENYTILNKRKKTK